MNFLEGKEGSGVTKTLREVKNPLAHSVHFFLRFFNLNIPLF